MASQKRSGADQTQPESRAAPLVNVTRGPLTESRHRGHIVAVTPRGKMVAFIGAPQTVTFMRSSAKPHQCIPLIATGAADHFGFTEREIALACASHSGESIHTDIAAAMLRKIGLDTSALKCGIHEPFSASVAQKLREHGEQPSVLQNNCSGKHAGMLALALYLGAPIETYNDPEHPVQAAIKSCVSRFSDVAVEQIVVGIDGCAVPVFAISLAAMAIMYARLIAPPTEMDEATRAACSRIVAAMTNHPGLIGGTVDRLDTEVMKATKGHLVSKVGAEGVYTAGILPSSEWPEGLGLALKIEDGDDHRARPTVVVEALRQLKVLRNEWLPSLSRFRSFAVRNRLGEHVGSVEASFQLDLPPPHGSAP